MTLRSRSAEDGERGQASVEFVGMVPLAILVALAVGQVLAAGAARELAGNAAAAGAAAILQGTAARAAAHDALPGWSDDHVAIAISDRRVRVRLRPVTVIPGVADRLTATVVADAGPRS
jgi:pilus assembly protein CpaE